MTNPFVLLPEGQSCRGQRSIHLAIHSSQHQRGHPVPVFHFWLFIRFFSSSYRANIARLSVASRSFPPRQGTTTTAKMRKRSTLGLSSLGLLLLVQVSANSLLFSHPRHLAPLISSFTDASPDWQTSRPTFPFPFTTNNTKRNEAAERLGLVLSWGSWGG